MSREVLFYMGKPFRQSLIDGHLFYVDQARKRLLSQFENIDAEADKTANEWLATHDHLFDPDRHDSADFYEFAEDAGIRFYESISDLRERTYLSVVAGMYHQWDKQFRNWLAREVIHWYRSDTVQRKIWRVDVGQLGQLMAGLGWPFNNASYFANLDACRLVVNVYKHGEGRALDQLKREHPEYLNDPFVKLDGLCGDVDLLDHTQLRVTDEQLQAFSDAIVAFWKNVPERIFLTETTIVPPSFDDAMNKYINEQRVEQTGTS